MKIIKVVAVALIENQKLLVALRSPTMSSPNLWELPGGKVEAGESDQEALVRECQEELNITISVEGFLADSEVQVGSRIIQMKVYRAVIQSGMLKKTELARYSPGLTGIFIDRVFEEF